MANDVSQFYRTTEPFSDDEVIGSLLDMCEQIAVRRMQQKARRTYESFLPGCMRDVYAAEVAYVKTVAIECRRMLRARSSTSLLATDRTRLQQKLHGILTQEQKAHLHFLKATGGLHIAE
jgi:hypothetical protein